MNKTTLRILIILSFVPLLFALDYTKLSPPIALTAFFARFSGLFGTVLLFWTFVLGLRSIVARFTRDMEWANRWHRKMGHYGTLLILLHPILISIYYWVVRGINLVNFEFVRESQVYKNIGIVAVLVLLITIFSSIYLRKRMSFRRWHFWHMLTYLVLPLVIIHNIGLGRDDVYLPMQLYWLAMAGVYAVLLVYQILFSLGKFKYRYQIEMADKESTAVMNIRMSPLGKKIRAHAGQYIYIQRKGSRESHPFSVSHFQDPVTDLLCIAPKALGKFSSGIQDVVRGEEVYIDGPYGVFTDTVDRVNKPVVFIAGGIGIVPFIPRIDMLKVGLGRDTYLFYGNNAEADIAFKDELDIAAAGSDRLKVVHVLRDEQKPGFENGYVTAELIHKYLPLHISKYEYFLCGPPKMIKMISNDLQKSGVPKSAIHFELFG